LTSGYTLLNAASASVTACGQRVWASVWSQTVMAPDAVLSSVGGLELELLLPHAAVAPSSTPMAAVAVAILALTPDLPKESTREPRSGAFNTGHPTSRVREDVELVATLWQDPT
jgi:hypothetical protein